MVVVVGITVEIWTDRITEVTTIVEGDGEETACVTVVTIVTA